MKFLFHHRTLGRGGEGVHIASLVRALKDLGHTIMVVSPPGVDPLKMAGDSPLDKGSSQVQGVNRIWKLVSCWVPDIFFEILEISYNIYVLFRVGPILKRRSQDVYYERYAFFMFMGVVLAKYFGWPVLLEVNEIVGVKRARKQLLVPSLQMARENSFQKCRCDFYSFQLLKSRDIKPERKTWCGACDSKCCRFKNFRNERK